MVIIGTNFFALIEIGFLRNCFKKWLFYLWNNRILTIRNEIGIQYKNSKLMLPIK